APLHSKPATSCGTSHATRLGYALPGAVALWAKSRRRPKAGGHSPKGPPHPARSASRRNRVLFEAADGVVGQVIEPRVLAEELELDRARRAVSLLADDDLGQSLVRRILLVVVLVAVDEDDHVRVLLDRAGLAQVGHHRALVGARLQRAVEL